MPRTYKQLSVEERDRISLLRGQGKSLRSIARSLGRDPSTLSRELKRSPATYCSPYLSHRAQARADARKAAGHKRQRLRGSALRSYVRRQIRNGWSPERIAGRWKLLGNGRISHEAIYQWLYAEERDLVCHLPRAHRKRLRRKRNWKPRMFYISSRIPISERPQIVAARKQAGHWEGDTMLGRRHRSVLQIIVERKTRYTRLTKLKAKTAGEMRRAINRSLGHYPAHMRRSMTYDNGRENVEHTLVNQTLGMRSYFCAPMHSWEKGTVENAAGLVRRRLPKKTDFAKVSVAELEKVERWLNSLPRKCLGYRTATEAFRRSVALSG
jgi:IS30 family transposase